MTRVTMWMLLAIVAAAAAVLSFSALRDLAELCGFARSLAWLLPVVVDAGAAAGCLVWLGGNRYQLGTGFGTGFARTMTGLLLASSVAGNALVHGLSAYSLRPAWWTVVLVSAVAPAVLGAVVHLAVLVGRPGTEVSSTGPPGDDLTAEVVGALAAEGAGSDDPTAGMGRRLLARELGVTEYQARQLLAERNGAAS
jgi:hypothetical protein